jgi:hypothetical protein
MASPNIHMIGQFVLNQVLYLPSDIAGYFLAPWSKGNVVLWFVTTLLVFCAVSVGWVRLAKEARWAPVHLGAILYILSLMSWDYPDWQRFLLLFLPIITGSFWLQGKRWILQIMSAVPRLPSFGEKVVAGGVALLFLVLFGAVLWNYAGPSRVWSLSVRQQREQLLSEKQEAYAWLRRNAVPGEHVIAMEDGSVYLYSGIQSMVPIVPLPGGIYDQNQAKSDMDHMMDVAQAIQAKYWVASPDDFENTQKFFRPLLTSRSKELQAVLPAVFRSSYNHVVVYGLACVREPQAAGCGSATPVLFPAGIPPQNIGNTQGLLHQ